MWNLVFVRPAANANGTLPPVVNSESEPTPVSEPAPTSEGDNGGNGEGDVKGGNDIKGGKGLNGDDTEIFCDGKTFQDFLQS